MSTPMMAAREALGELPNPLGLQGVEFIEYATSRPQALGQALGHVGRRGAEYIRQHQGFTPLHEQGTGPPLDPVGSGIRVHVECGHVGRQFRECMASHGVQCRGQWRMGEDQETGHCGGLSGLPGDRPSHA